MPDTSDLNAMTLVAHWPLTDGQGTTVKDEGPRNADGTLHGDPGWTDGFIDFNGSSYITCGTVPSLSGKVPFTVSAWVKTTDGKIQIIQQRDSKYNGEYWLSIDKPGAARFCLYGNGAYQFQLASTVKINDGQWHHVAGVRDGDIARLYVDGKEEAVSPKKGARDLDGTISVAIGADIRDSINYFKGSIGQVRIYQNALNPAQIGVLASQSPVSAPQPTDKSADGDASGQSGDSDAAAATGTPAGGDASGQSGDSDAAAATGASAGDDASGQSGDADAAAATGTPAASGGNKSSGAVDAAIKIVGERILPGASLMMEGQIRAGVGHTVAGVLGHMLLGPLGVALVAVNSLSNSFTGKGVLKNLKK